VREILTYLQSECPGLTVKPVPSLVVWLRACNMYFGFWLQGERKGSNLQFAYQALRKGSRRYLRFESIYLLRPKQTRQA
jgi:hypothetical protein